jgi:hypothetical protein
MKTITLLILLSIATLISCGDSVEENQDFVPPTTEIRETYKLKEYYEKTVVIDNQTNSDDIYGYNYSWSSGRITLGFVVFSGRYTNKIVLDTLVIDLTKIHNKTNRIVFNSMNRPNQIEHKYTTINHLQIIGLDDSRIITIEGDDIYDKIQINSSNIPVEKLNEYSVRNNNIAYDLFEKVELRRKEVSFTFREHSTPQYPSIYHNFVNQEKGFIGYGYGRNEGTKYQIISKDK